MGAAEKLVSLSRASWPKFFGLTHDRFWADELVQVASLKWWQNYVATGKMAPFKFMIVVGCNHYFDFKRKTAREQRVQDDSIPDPRKDHVAEVEHSELLVRVLGDLSNLPCIQKFLIEQIYLQAQPSKAVAEAIGRPHPTIRTRLKRGLDQLRRRFAD